jgi:hypothetical protein
MAGDWTHPKVVRIASALKADRLRVVGGLHAVWCLFDAHSADGSLEGYTLDALDDLIGWPGFSAAMVGVEWMKETPQSLDLPRFEEHNGQSAKRRAQETERKRMARAEADLSAPEADEKRTREEKRREEKKEEKKTSPLRDVFVPPEWIPSETWVAYLKTRTKKRSDNNPHALGLIVKDLEDFKSRGFDALVILETSIKSGWAGVFEPKAQGGDRGGGGKQAALEARNRAVIDDVFAGGI